VSEVRIDWRTGEMRGATVETKHKRLGEMRGAFRDQRAFAARAAEEIVYSVEFWRPVQEGTPGGLFWGQTTILPGLVGDEYFMTAGHFHAVRDRAEYYVTIRGEGGLLLMDEDGRTRWEPMSPGSVHYIPGRVAHRVANTGGAPLTFVACWPSDAGHDYGTIAERGFSARLRKVNGRPELIAGERP
jgi:glucose-6-phosphate isomerase